MHKVKRKETVFSISREYGISEAELIAANPELKGENKIKKGWKTSAGNAWNRANRRRMWQSSAC